MKNVLVLKKNRQFAYYKLSVKYWEKLIVLKL